MVDVTKENLSFLNEVNSDNEQQDSSSTLSDGEDTAADLFDSFMEIAKTAELQNASDTSTDFAVVASDDNCCITDGANVTVSKAGAVLGEEININDNADSANSLFSNSSQESSNKCEPTDEQQVKTREASRSAEEKSSKVLKKEGSSMKSKKKSSANISDRLSRTLDSLDILEQQLFTFMQTQTEQCEENKDGEMKVGCNIESKEEDSFNKPENEDEKPLSVASHNEIDKEDVSLMSWNKGEKVDSNHSLEQSQAKQVVDNTSTETEIQLSSVEHQKHYSETEPRQQEGSQLENVYQEKEENHENDEKEPPQDNRSEGNFIIKL